MRNYSNATYVFDLDGVITDPRDSSVDEVVVEHIVHILGQGGYVAVNTGRSYFWVRENLMMRLHAKLKPSVFERMYIVCEKGGESRLWQGEEHSSQPSRFALAPAITELVRRIFNEHESELNTMFWDATKQTMATIEKYPKASLDDFREQQERLTELLRTQLAYKEVRIDPTTIATDVESPLAGKHAGAELIYEWVAKHTSVKHDTFICFGDSVSDYEMARYFSQQGARTSFVYVGKPSDALSEAADVTLIRTDSLYAAGTREYFEYVSKSVK